MPPRIYCPSLAAIGKVALSESEAHHLTHSLRQGVGDAIEVFNGTGLVGKADIVSIRKHDVECNVTEVRQEPEPDRRLTLATAVPKGERFDWLVEKATELGVHRLIPLITARSTVDPRGSKLDRLRQLIIAACKQSRRAWLMELTAPLLWTKFLADGLDGKFAIAHPGTDGRPMSVIGREPHVTFAVGPEGGFTDEEIQAAIERDGRVVILGPDILRIETACVAVAAWNRLRDPGASN